MRRSVQSPSISVRFCTAAPLAPLPRLSSRATATACAEAVTVQDAPESGKLDAVALKNTNQLEIRVFGNPEAAQAVAVARLDNLGKGASGAAVQNLKLMLGL